MTLVQDPLQDPVQQKQPLLNGHAVHVVPTDSNAAVDVDVNVKNTVTETTTEVKPEPEIQTKPRFEIEEHPIDQVRDIKVGVIGAGLAGVTAAVLLPAKLPGLDLRVYEKNPDVVRLKPSPCSYLSIDLSADGDRAAPGSKTRTPACVATSPRTSINPASRPTRSGPRSLRRATRSASTGSLWRASSTRTSTSGSGRRCSARNGWRRRRSGS